VDRRVLVLAHQARVASDVGAQDGGELTLPGSLLLHPAPWLSADRRVFVVLNGPQT
jgi:hypothetical protein